MKKEKPEERSIEQTMILKNVPESPEQFNSDIEFEDVIPNNPENKTEVTQTKNKWIEAEAIIFSIGGFNFCNFWFNAKDVVGFSALTENDLMELGVDEQQIIEFDLQPEKCVKVYLAYREEPILFVDIAPEQLLLELE